MSEGVCPPFVATGGHDVSCRDDYSDSMTSSTRASVQVLKTDLHVAVAQARRLEILPDLARSTAAQQRCAALSRKVKLWRARSQVKLVAVIDRKSKPVLLLSLSIPSLVFAFKVLIID